MNHSCLSFRLQVWLSTLLILQQNQPSVPSHPLLLWLQWAVSPRSWSLARQRVMLNSHLTHSRSNCPSPVTPVHPEVSRMKWTLGLHRFSQTITELQWVSKKPWRNLKSGRLEALMWTQLTASLLWNPQTTHCPASTCNPLNPLVKLQLPPSVQ